MVNTEGNISQAIVSDPGLVSLPVEGGRSMVDGGWRKVDGGFDGGWGIHLGKRGPVHFRTPVRPPSSGDEPHSRPISISPTPCPQYLLGVD